VSGSATRLLETSGRCLVAFTGAPWPLTVPLAQWYDGRELWLAAGAATARSLAEHPACAVGVPGDDVVAVGTGQARVFGLGDPAGLALHAGPVAGAATVLAARNVAAMLGSMRDAVLAPARLLDAAVVRVSLDDVAVLAWSPMSTPPPPPRPPGVPPPPPPAPRSAASATVRATRRSSWTRPAPRSPATLCAPGCSSRSSTASRSPT
jgi:hypothetical protein